MALANDANITAWFLDAATRHPDIRHTPENKRFYEEEWELLLQNGKALGAKDWVLLLEDYEERFADPIAEYISITPVIAFMVGKHVPKGRKDLLQHTYEEARRIGKSIIAKLKQDELDACDADVPANVTPPVLVDIHTLRINRVQLPMFDEAFGVRVSIMIRTDQETTFSRDEVAWLPLVPEEPEEPEEPAFVCSGPGYASFTALADAVLTVVTDSGYVTIRNATTGVLTTVESGVELAVPEPGSYCLWASNAAGEKTGAVIDINDAGGANFTAFDTTGLAVLSFVIMDSALDSFVPPVEGQLQQLVLPNTENKLNGIDLSAQPSLDEVILAFAGDSLSFAGSTVLRTLTLTNPELTSLVPPPNASLQASVVRGCALDRTSVDGLINACDANFISGTLHVDEGTNAGPSLAVADKLADLMASSWKVSTN